MKENWSIKNNKLVVSWETGSGKTGETEFMLDFIEGTLFLFKGIGVKGVIRLHYNKILKCYVPMTNNTSLKAHVNLDFSMLKPDRECPFQIKYTGDSSKVKYD